MVSNFVAWAIIFSFSSLFLLLRRRSSGVRRRPPGPPGWPIIGNIFDLGHMPHRTLTKLKDQYGDVLWLRLGAMNTMAIQSAKAASEFFKNNDMSFADRTVNEVMRSHDIHLSSLAIAPYGTHWRVMRRLVTVEMLVIKRINESAPVRRRCIDSMLAWVEEEARGTNAQAEGIHVAHFVFMTSFNLLGNLMLSRDLLDPKAKVGHELFGATVRVMEWSGRANLADLFPWIRRVGPQGLRRKMDRDVGKVMEIIGGFVKERLREDGDDTAARGGKSRDFLDVLLKYEGNGKDEPHKLSEKEIIVFILEIFFAGTETTSSTTEWVLSELLRDPKSMTKVKAELNEIVGPYNKKLEESDIDNLPYLKAVVKETLRLHPPIPFLVPRKAVHDTKFMGYDVPKDTQVFVNAWAIGRDSEIWEDPLSFKPERFLGSEIDYKGQNYEFIPFGAGRRMCAGTPLASRVLNLIAGSLLHDFDWELGGSVNPKTLDMNDRLGITVRKLKPLMAIPKKSCIV